MQNSIAGWCICNRRKRKQRWSWTVKRNGHLYRKQPEERKRIPRRTNACRPNMDCVEEGERIFTFIDPYFVPFIKLFAQSHYGREDIFENRFHRAILGYKEKAFSKYVERIVSTSTLSSWWRFTVRDNENKRWKIVTRKKHTILQDLICFEIDWEIRLFYIIPVKLFALKL